MNGGLVIMFVVAAAYAAVLVFDHWRIALGVACLALIPVAAWMALAGTGIWGVSILGGALIAALIAHLMQQGAK